MVILLFSTLLLPTLRNTFSIASSGTQEMLSLPFQQTASYVKKYSEEILDSEKEILDKVLDYNDLPSKYNPTNADMVKGYSPKGTTKDYINYLKIWGKQGLKHPDVYLSATELHLSGWFSFSLYKPLTDMSHHTQLDTNFMPEATAERSSFFSSTASLFDKTYLFIYSIPLIGILFTFAFSATIVPFFLLGTFIKKRKTSTKKYLLVCVPLFLSIILGCYLAPVSVHLEGMRYLYPVTYITPLILMLIISLYKKTTTR